MLTVPDVVKKELLLFKVVITALWLRFKESIFQIYMLRCLWKETPEICFQIISWVE